MTAAEMILRHCPWMAEAKSHLGKAEIPGVQTAGFIAAMLRNVHAWWGDDETPWCGVFVAHCLKTAGRPLAKQWWKARGWVGYGYPWPLRNAIPYGALVVLNRPPRVSDGHVGFFTGRVQMQQWPTGGVKLLAGNQGNKVCHASFDARRVIYWGWPGESLPAPDVMSLLAAYAASNVASPVRPSAGEA